MNSDESGFDEWHDPVLLIDSNARVRRANKPACDLFGYSGNDFPGVPMRSLSLDQPADRHAWIKAMHSNDGSEKSAELAAGVDLKCVTRGGKPFLAYVTFEPAPRHGQNWRWVLIDIENTAEMHRQDGLPDLSGADTDQITGVGSRFTDVPTPGERIEKLGSLIRSMVKFDSIFDDIAEELAGLLPYSAFGIATIDEQTGAVGRCHITHRDTSPAPLRGTGARYSLSGTITEEVLRTRTPKLVTAASSEVIRRTYPYSVPEQSEMQFLSTIVAPVFDGERIPGVMVVQSTEGDAYDEDDVILVSRLAGAI